MKLAASHRKVVTQCHILCSQSLPIHKSFQRPAPVNPHTLLRPASRSHYLHISCNASNANSAQLQTSPPAPTPTALLWFKHDLRLDDHPGLHAALKAAKTVIPVFCFDPRRYEQLIRSPGSAAAFVRAVESLRSALRTLGSDLIIISGTWEEELPRLVDAVGAGVIVAEDEVETVYRQGLERTAGAVPSGVTVHTWTAPLFEASSDNYKGKK